MAASRTIMDIAGSEEGLAPELQGKATLNKEALGHELKLFVPSFNQAILRRSIGTGSDSMDSVFSAVFVKLSIKLRTPIGQNTLRLADLLHKLLPPSHKE